MVLGGLATNTIDSRNSHKSIRQIGYGISPGRETSQAREQNIHRNSRSVARWSPSRWFSSFCSCSFTGKRASRGAKKYRSGLTISAFSGVGGGGGVICAGVPQIKSV